MMKCSDSSVADVSGSPIIHVETLMLIRNVHKCHIWIQEELSEGYLVQILLLIESAQCEAERRNLTLAGDYEGTANSSGSILLILFYQGLLLTPGFVFED